MDSQFFPLLKSLLSWLHCLGTFVENLLKFYIYNFTCQLYLSKAGKKLQSRQLNTKLKWFIFCPVIFNLSFLKSLLLALMKDDELEFKQKVRMEEMKQTMRVVVDRGD